jgi:hypothetical protein
LVGVIEKSRVLPVEEGAMAILVGICLSKARTWTRVHDCLQGLSGWHLQIGLPVQQQVLPPADVPAAHAGWGLPIPSASTAIRIWTKVLMRTSTLEQLQYHERISSPVMADYIPQPIGQLVVVGVALPLTIEPQVAMDAPKGFETVVPVWSQRAFSIGQ